MKPSFKFIRVRDVHVPTRANAGDAGIDFYVPNDLTTVDLNIANSKNNTYSDKIIFKYDNVQDITDISIITHIILPPHSRISIPSGIRGILEPEASMLQANNKSGISSNGGIIFSAEVVDSGYLGEIHLGVINTGKYPYIIEAGKKLVQFVHIPIYLSEPEEIKDSEFMELKTKKELESGRGEAGMGSGKETLPWIY